MSLTAPTARRHDDPLATAAERVPLAWPTGDQPVSVEAASPAGTRPFGLRFAVDVVQQKTPLPPWTYCPDRQIAIGEDGKRWLLNDGKGSMATTGPSTDGKGSTGGEEWTPDYMSDEVG